jgi:hypothetical protein
MSKKAEHMGMTMTEEEHERWHREQAEVTPEQHEALMKQMGISTQYVTVTADALIVDLADGRTVSVPLAWYPRLWHGTPEERNNWRLIGKGEGIHWPHLDEDLSVENIVFGKPSGESQRSFKRWLENRAARGKQPQLQKAASS